MNEKAVMYLYPDERKASNLKIYKEKISQITAFYFSRDNVSKIREYSSSNNYSIYFLINDSEDDASSIYVGQSINGISRIVEHTKQKNFWSKGLLFITDDNSFDKLIIDQLEYMFIQKAMRSEYLVENKDERSKKPNISIYDEPVVDDYVRQIEFLLRIEGIVLSEKKISKSKKFYKASKNYNANVFVEDGIFYLTEGSEVKRPTEASKNWKNKNHYERGNRIIDGFLEDGKVAVENDKLITQINIPFKKPSAAADLVTGGSENGWLFFKGLMELREEK